MMMTLSCLRLSRPLVRSTMSRAWSHGTFCRRSVTLPPHGVLFAAIVLSAADVSRVLERV